MFEDISVNVMTERSRLPTADISFNIGKCHCKDAVLMRLLEHHFSGAYRIDKFDTREINIFFRELVDNLSIVDGFGSDKFMT